MNNILITRRAIAWISRAQRRTTASQRTARERRLTAVTTLVLAGMACMNFEPLHAVEPGTALTLTSPNAFSESYVRRYLGSTNGTGTPASTAVNNPGVIALHIGSNDGPLKLTLIQVYVPDSATNDQFCVTIRTSDGRYLAENTYYRAARADGWASLEIRSKYGKELETIYSANDTLVKSIRTASCDNTSDGVLLPVRSSALSAGGPLTLYLNAPGLIPQASMQLNGSSDAEIATCAQSRRASSMLHTHSCIWPKLSDRTFGPATIKVSFSAYAPQVSLNIFLPQTK